MKKLLALTLAVALSATAFVGCAKQEPAPTETTPTETTTEEATPTETTTTETTEPAADAAGDKPYIAVISKGFQHQFWQTVAAGAQAAADKYGATISFEGPPSESDIANQVDMLNSALSKNPKAICLAALDTQAVTSQLEDAKANKIPVIGFDSGVPNAPEGSITSTASTNNFEAGTSAAENMLKAPGFADKLKAATAENPVTIGVFSQDATSQSIVDRTAGFIDKMATEAGGETPGAVEVTGHDKYNKKATEPAKVILQVTVPPTSSAADSQSAAQSILQNSKNLIAIYCSNESSAGGLLAATTDGADLDREKGTYKDITVVGFDAGQNQKNAVKNKYFYGSVTQDPYQIGFLAVELAYKSIKGEAVEPSVDTGSKFYTSENMAEADIAPLLYD